jgi:hypothetical protein
MNTLYWGLEIKSPIAWPPHLLCLGLASTNLKEMEGNTAVIRKESPIVCYFPASPRLHSVDSSFGYSEHYIQNAFDCKIEQCRVGSLGHCFTAAFCPHCSELSGLASYWIVPKLQLKEVVNKLSHFCSGCSWPCGPGSSVSIATGYRPDGPGIESRWGWDFPHLSRLVLGPTQLPVQ